jgi:transposase-like protein
MEQYITIHDVASALEVSTTSLYNWRTQGLLTMSQPYGPKVNLVARTELHRLLRERLDTVCNSLKRTAEGAAVLAEYWKEFSMQGTERGCSGG